jgi:hypothetical protein
MAKVTEVSQPVYTLHLSDLEARALIALLEEPADPGQHAHCYLAEDHPELAEEIEAADAIFIFHELREALIDAVPELKKQKEAAARKALAAFLKRQKEMTK